MGIDVSPAKLCAGKECEKTRQFLQYFCIAATGKKVGAVSAAPAPAPARKQPRPVEPKPVEPEPVPVTESKTDNVELPDKPRAQSRPTTARRAPPKLANAAQKKDRKKEFVLEDVGTDGVILDGDEEVPPPTTMWKRSTRSANTKRARRTRVRGEENSCPKLKTS